MPVKNDEVNAALRQCLDAIDNILKESRRLKSKRAASYQEVTLAGFRPGGSDPATMMGHLKIGSEDRARYLDRYNYNVRVTPRTGHLRSPNPVTARNLVSLVGTEWINDTIVDNYLYLICLYGNRAFHFKDDVMQTGSPE
ncbi:MAG: hypothetical protein L6R41_004039 [Letrouitia leprolyta]|nr:MAG: hypothetical protein L6R41_004039 [Letrouitia leprolyta]